MWNSIYKFYRKKPSIPTIDFDEYSAILYIRGKTGIKDLELNIVIVAREGNKIGIKSTEFIASENCEATLANLTVFSLITVPKVEGSILGVSEETVERCAE